MCVDKTVKMNSLENSRYWALPLQLKAKGQICRRLQKLNECLTYFRKFCRIKSLSLLRWNCFIKICTYTEHKPNRVFTVFDI
jgi:hypothetical protein